MKIICVVIVNYNGYRDTIECVNSVLKSKTECDIRIVVVDNCSPNDSVKHLHKEFDSTDVAIIESERNGGFSYGNNLGIEYARKIKADACLFLNNDTVIDCNMIEHLSLNLNPDIVTVPKIYYFSQPELICYGGGKISRLKGLGIHLYDSSVDTLDNSTTTDVSFATGCCLMIPMQIIDAIGMWDESYFLYQEDLDYSIRIVSSGFSIRYIPSAKMWHKGGSSTGNNSKISVYYFNRNRFYVISKYELGATAFIYSFITRFMKCIKGYICGTNEKYIYTAWKDFRHGKYGEKQDWN